MVFEETASHKPLSSATWTDRSALVPKAPAPPKFSHLDAQTHRLSEPAGELLPVPCLKEPFKYDIGFESEDYVFRIDGCARPSLW